MKDLIHLLNSVITVSNDELRSSSIKYSQSISAFLDEFQTFVSATATTPHQFTIPGDFNIHLDDLLTFLQFTDLLSFTNLTQHVFVSTQIHNHTLDLVITSSHTSLSPTISQSFTTISDYFPIFTHLNLTPTPPPLHFKFTFRRTKALISSNSITTSLHPIYFYTLLHDYLNCLIATIPHYAHF